MTGRLCRPVHERVAAATRQLQAALDKHAASLTAGDVQEQHQNFAAWIGHCEATSRATLSDTIQFIRSAIESARAGYGRDAKATRYVDIRSTFLEYAEAAMARRFAIEAQP